MTQRAIVIGAGIGGLAAAAGLHRAGWHVTLCERASSLEPVGAGLAVAPNGLRALDTFGAGDQVRSHAVTQELGIRRPGGRWLVRSSAKAIAARFGDPVIVASRAAVIDALLGAVPSDALRLAVTVTEIDGSGHGRPCALARTSVGDLDADLIVAADGLHSAARQSIFGAAAEVVYAGFTAWRMLAGSIGRDVPMTETWGRGVIFGVIPLADGRIYCYAAARAQAGARSPDDRAELGRIFGRWHDPIPQLVAAAMPAQILHHDVAALALPLPAFHRGRVCLLGDAAHPMAPNLGQGGNQALEDAAVLSHLMTGADSAAVPERLAMYTQQRLARTTAIVRRSRRVAAIMMWRSPLATAARDGAALAAGRLAPGAAIRGLAPVFDWTPPQGKPR